MMRFAVSPFPAIAAGAGPFHVVDAPAASGGSCSAPSGQEPGLFQAPLEAGSIQALAIRMHEIGHLGLLRLGSVPEPSAFKKAGLHVGWVQFSLDVVVNAFMITRGNAEVAELKMWDGTLPAEIPRWLAAMEFLRSEGLSRELRLRMSLQARAQFSEEELKLLFASARLLRQRGEQAALLSVKELRRMLRKLQHTFGPRSRDATDERLLQAFASPGSGARTPDLHRHEWGPMVLREPPLTQRRGKGHANAARKLTSSHCGAFRFPHRALLPASDGRAFGLKRRAHGGTILIDCSGSMHLTTDQVRGLVTLSPAATIALYAGLPGHESGALFIVARNGCFAAIEEVIAGFGHGNIVDGHALGWLSRQCEPRIWVSDGCVTGRGDESGANLAEETDRIVQSARIKRIESLCGLQQP